MRRITKAALGGLAGCALVLGGTQAASGSDVIKHLLGDLPLYRVPPQSTTDPADTGLFDKATASLRIMETPEGTGFKLNVKGIDTSVAGREFGSHLHVGECVPRPVTPETPWLDQTGKHYRHIEDGPPISENEVWFAVIPNANGEATYDNFVTFPVADRPGDPAEGKMSIVIHALPTNPTTGTAGAKLTCLPLEVAFLTG